MRYFIRHKLALLATLVVLVLSVTSTQSTYAGWSRFGGGVDGNSEKLWALNVFSVCRDGILVGVASTTVSGEVNVSALNNDSFAEVLPSTDLTVSEKTTPIILPVPVPDEGTVVDRDFFFYDYYYLPWNAAFGDPFDIETEIEFQVLADPVGGQQFIYDVSDCASQNGYGYNYDWGLQYAGYGQITTPSSVTTDPSGNVYVAEFGRIQKFSNTGVFLTQFEPDSGDDITVYLSDLAIDTDGNIVILDRNNFRIVKLDNNGNYLTQWGGERGIGAIDEPLMDSPFGIDTDAAGNVYVVDSYGYDRVIKYSSTGTFIQNFPIDIPSVTYENLADIALDSAGSMYIVDDAADVVAKFNSLGTFLIEWGGTGTTNGLFDNPEGIAIDDSDFVYVLDWGNNRIQKFNVIGAYQAKWNVTNGGSFETPGDIAAGAGSDVYTTDYSDNRLRKYNGVNGALVFTIGEYGNGDGQLARPTGMAMSSDETVYVVDTANNRVQTFDKEGTYLGQWGSIGNGNGEFNLPTGITITPDDTVYIVDTNNNRIQYFDLAGNYLGQWGTAGLGDGAFSYPSDIAMDSEGNVYVADTGNYRIQKFSSTGTYITQWGSFGFTDGLFSYPTALEFNSEDTLYVVDTGRQIIQTFDTAGTYIGQWGSFGSNQGQFSQPLGISMDVFDNVYISDADNIRMQKFDKDGNFITSWRMANLSSGSGNDEKPWDSVVDSEGNVYVADYITNRVHVYTNANAPLVNDDSYNAIMNTEYTAPAGSGVLANDQEDILGEDLTAVLLQDVTNGTLVLNGDGTFTYTPNTDFLGTDTFTYYATDDSTTDSLNIATVTINVVNPAPIANADDYSTYTNTVLDVGVENGVLSNDTDENSDPLTAVLMVGVLNGSLTLNPDGSFTYTPGANYVGSDSFTYVANDGTSSSNEVAVNIVIDNETPEPAEVVISLPIVEGNAYPTFSWEVTNPPADWYEIIVTLNDDNLLIYDQWKEASELCTTTLCTFLLDSSVLPFGVGEGEYTVTVNAWTWIDEEAGTGDFVEASAQGTFTVGATGIVNADSGRPILTFQDDPSVTWVNVYVGTADFSETVDFSWYEKATMMDCDGTTCTLYPDAHPTHNGDYAVWLQTWDGSNVSQWSGPFPFSLNFAAAPLIDPLTATVSAGSATFSWNGNNGTTWYQLWVGTDAPDYVTSYLQWHPAVDLSCNGGGVCSITLDSLGLVAGEGYSWWVQAWGPGGVTTEGEAGWQEGGNFTP